MQPQPNLAELRRKLSHFSIDVNIVPKANRRKRLLIADMDSTMIQQECIDELGVVAGLGDQIKEITVRAMRGEIDFPSALRERVGLMAGLDAKVIDTIMRDRITLMPGGKTLVATMKSHGAYTALVSGGFRQFTSRVAPKSAFMPMKPMTSSLRTENLQARWPNRFSARKPSLQPSIISHW